MVVWKEESYLRTKHKFRNRISSSTEFKFCEQHTFSLRSIEIIGETLPPHQKNSAYQIVSFPHWITPLFSFTSVNMPLNEF